MTQLENRLSRIRKLSEMLDDIGEAMLTLKGERDMLTAQLTSELIADKDVFNVFRHKNLSAGLIGRNYFAVSFPTALARKGGKRMDDQDWLHRLGCREWQSGSGVPYVRTKYELDKAKLTADYKSGVIDDDFLEAFELRFEKAAKLSVLKCRADAEVKELIAEAQREADAID